MLGPVELIVLAVVLALIVKYMNRKKSNKTADRSNALALLVVFGLLLAVPLVLVVLFYARMGASQQATTIVQTDYLSGNTVNHLAAAPTVWANLEQQPFDANIYPSRTAAAKPLARKVRAAIDSNRLLTGNKTTKKPLETDADAADAVAAESAGDEVKATSAPDDAEAEAEAAESVVTRLTAPMYFMVYENGAGKDVLTRFAEQLQPEFPISEVRVAQQNLGEQEAETVVESGAVRIVLRSKDEHLEVTEDRRTLQQIQGQLFCDIVTADGSTTLTADYIQKPWVEKFDTYVSTRPNEHYAVGYSTELVSSEQEARQLALRDAANNARLAFGGGPAFTLDDSFVVDRFAQKLSRPYGDVWREAVLLDVSPDRMRPTLVEAQIRVTGQKREQFSLAAALAALFGLTIVLCLAFNFLTQGYYRNRMLLGVVVVLGAVLVMTMA